MYITYSEAGTWRGYYVRVPGTPKKLFSVRGLGEDVNERVSSDFLEAVQAFL